MASSCTLPPAAKCEAAKRRVAGRGRQAEAAGCSWQLGSDRKTSVRLLQASSGSRLLQLQLGLPMSSDF